jgi:hypothetical protein
MGLFNQFISAAVRQVGRDGGKVISNQIYGNAHSSKVVFVNENQQFSSSKEIFSYEQLGYEEGDYVYGGTQYFKLSFGHWLWLIVFVPIPFLGFLGSTYFAYRTFFVKYFQSSAPLIWKSIQIKDGRKKEGFREQAILTPDKSKQEIIELSIPLANMIYSILAFLLSSTTTFLIIWIIKTVK